MMTVFLNQSETRYLELLKKYFWHFILPIYPIWLKIWIFTPKKKANWKKKKLKTVYVHRFFLCPFWPKVVKTNQYVWVGLLSPFFGVQVHCLVTKLSRKHTFQIICIQGYQTFGIELASKMVKLIDTCVKLVELWAWNALFPTNFLEVISLVLVHIKYYSHPPKTLFIRDKKELTRAIYQIDDWQKV